MEQEYTSNEEKIGRALSLCKNFGAIEECEHHSGEYFEAERYGADELTSLILGKEPQAIEPFDGKEEMTNYIQEVMNVGSECGMCAKISNS